MQNKFIPPQTPTVTRTSVTLLKCELLLTNYLLGGLPGGVTIIGKYS